MASYFAFAALVWGVADAVMSPLRSLQAVPEDAYPMCAWRIAHLSDLHAVGERYGFRIESGRAGPRGNERMQRLFARLDAIHAVEPLDAVLVTGDVTNAGRSAEWAEFFMALAPYPDLPIACSSCLAITTSMSSTGQIPRALICRSAPPRLSRRLFSGSALQPPPQSPRHEQRRR